MNGLEEQQEKKVNKRRTIGTFGSSIASAIRLFDSTAESPWQLPPPLRLIQLAGSLRVE